MSNERIHIIDSIAERKVLQPQKVCPANITFFADDVFSVNTMRHYLQKIVADKLIATINDNVPLDPTIAGDVAQAMKAWAMERGATHYTHWFQPLTGGTAEKHDSFLENDGPGQAIMKFSAKNLIQGEPDASSFPSGGLRSTFEARGYTAWDPTSPAFIKRHANGATLCIPTAFFSYTGEVLDRKTPLLRSLRALKNSIIRLMDIFDVPKANPVITLGIEQEYFLIDKSFYLHRPDLVQTGRTLFGAPPAKHQQLEDHYFGAIRPRILKFMTEVEQELWHLGIPAKTRHNEVAPAQFELAPIFEEQNLAVDHNMLVMEVLRLVAERNGLVCLLHEKPFAGLNGSGKHNNWSITYGGRNLLDPGTDPRQNAIFLTVLAAVVRAIDLHSDLLRTATIGAGNDHRLGANEAPPAVISIFLGSQLTKVIDVLENGSEDTPETPNTLRIGVDTLPALPQDTTDRNRTSPFAFTGNKFEFRAPGSSQSCSGVNMLLNTIVAESLDYFSNQLEQLNKSEFNNGLTELLKECFHKHKKIIFNGDNYSSEWLAEAEKRGLPSANSTMPALQALLATENQDLLNRYGVLSPTETNSRFEVFLEEYHRKIRIEGEVSLEVAKNIILPVVQKEYGKILTIYNQMSSMPKIAGTQCIVNNTLSMGEAIDNLDKCICDLAKALKEEHQDIINSMEIMRKVIDYLETITDDSVWPLPKYREMLFIY